MADISSVSLSIRSDSVQHSNDLMSLAGTVEDVLGHVMVAPFALFGYLLAAVFQSSLFTSRTLLDEASKQNLGIAIWHIFPI
ncbi:hypothetical protein [Sphingobium sp. AntQ-1]|uniref:hypothetical protein n=1 Tax=Sphingobium sp. AntQ-1 TaxID=2930091 RepID=UPI00234EE9D0|nr:hypothetical protein [Sphingobium sp. AntQ-1]